MALGASERGETVQGGVGCSATGLETWLLELPDGSGVTDQLGHGGAPLDQLLVDGEQARLLTDLGAGGEAHVAGRPECSPR